MPALAEHFHVVAVDIIGEAGNSEENRLDLTTGAYAQWLNEVIEELGIASVNLIGNSLGGWLALNFAVTYPQKTEHLVLLASSGIAPIKSDFRAQASAVKAGDEESREDLSNAMFDESIIPPEVLTYMNLIMENFIPMTDDLLIYTEVQLHRLTMPVLFIAGELDDTFDAKDAAARLKESVPNVKTYVLPDCGHVVIGAMPLILPFLIEE
jgi:pimeloyl-ACP methyl ester carboxylesterase